MGLVSIILLFLLKVRPQQVSPHPLPPPTHPHPHPTVYHCLFCEEAVSSFYFTVTSSPLSFLPAGIEASHQYS